MKIKKYCYFYLLLLMLFAVPLPVLGQNSGQNANKTGDSLSQENDCSDTSIDFTDSGTPLTIDEKIARMDNAFYASLNKFDRCQTSTENQSSSSASQSSSDNNDGTTGVRGTENIVQKADSGGSSVASAAVSGTSSPPPPDAKSQPEETQTQESKNASGGTPTSLQSANGKAPDDIPPGDNDSILEAQIRAAAIAENDPARKRRLWDEYRRYKGLKTPATKTEN